MMSLTQQSGSPYMVIGTGSVSVAVNVTVEETCDAPRLPVV